MLKYIERHINSPTDEYFIRIYDGAFSLYCNHRVYDMEDVEYEEYEKEHPEFESDFIEEINAIDESDLDFS